MSTASRNHFRGRASSTVEIAGAPVYDPTIPSIGTPPEPLTREQRRAKRAKARAARQARRRDR